MKRVIILLLFALSSVPMVAQLSSTDIRDGSTTGPFPLYLGLGFANSFRNQDLVDIGKDFIGFNNSDQHFKTRLYGLQAMAGVSIIPDNSDISYVVEARYLWLKRPIEVTGNEFSLEKNQLSLGGGVRIAFFPIVFQAQLGGILRHFRYYRFNVNGTSTTSLVNDVLPGLTGLVRIGLLDPAGTEGGLGIYFEAGYNVTGFDKTNGELSNAITSYDPSHQGALDSNNRYGYLSVGILLPIAIRIR